MDKTKAVTEILKDVHQALYGKSTPDSIFAGGNVGMVSLGLSIEAAAERIAGALDQQKQVDQLLRKVAMLEREAAEDEQTIDSMARKLTRCRAVMQSNDPGNYRQIFGDDMGQATSKQRPEFSTFVVPDHYVDLDPSVGEQIKAAVDKECGELPTLPRIGDYVSADDGWIEWNGNGGRCPLPDGTAIDYKLRDGSCWHGCTKPNELRWGHIGSVCDIVAYRLHKPTPAGIDSRPGSTRSPP